MSASERALVIERLRDEIMQAAVEYYRAPTNRGDSLPEIDLRGPAED